MTTAPIAAVIVAGGRGMRLGGCVKALIEIDGVTILDRELVALRSITQDIAIAANDETVFAAWALPVVPDPQPNQGPLAGIAAALTWSPHPRVLCVAGDMPYVSGAVLEIIASEAPAADIVLPHVAGRDQPLCAVYSVRCLPVIAQRLQAGKRGLVELARDPSTGLHVERLGEEKFLHVDPSLLSFHNVNTASDLP